MTTYLFAVPYGEREHLWQQSLRALIALQEAVHMDIASNTLCS